MSTPTNCTRCGIALVPGSTPSPLPEGTRRHHGHGRCSACASAYLRERRAAERAAIADGLVPPMDIPEAPADDSWREDAACLQQPVSRTWDPWHPSEGNTATAKDALMICGGCDVRMQCLGDALATQDDQSTTGIRGGLSANKRKMLALSAKRPLGPIAADRCGEEAGYARHRRAGEPPCAACVEAMREKSRTRSREYKAKLRAQKLEQAS